MKRLAIAGIPILFVSRVTRALRAPWAISPGAGLRLPASNLAARDCESRHTIDAETPRSCSSN